MRAKLVNLILERLKQDTKKIREDFHSEKGFGTRFTVIENVLPEEIARKIYKAFPPLDEMRLLNSFREKKRTSKSLEKYDSLIADITFAFQDERVIGEVADITGIKDLEGDPKLYAGGISAMEKGHFLNPHIDNSHDYEQKNYRVLNLLYYCTPDWKPEYGGNLEIWNDDLTKCIEIPSLFNRLAIMSTNNTSWHSVNKVKVERTRYCVANYYFSPHSPNNYETAHITYFQARPEQVARRIITKADSKIRTLLRKVKKSGFSKKDLYEGNGKKEQ